MHYIIYLSFVIVIMLAVGHSIRYYKKKLYGKRMQLLKDESRRLRKIEIDKLQMVALRRPQSIYDDADLYNNVHSGQPLINKKDIN